MATNLKKEISYSAGGILSKQLVKNGLDITLFCMAAGTAISEHTASREGAVFVVEGKGEFVLLGKKIPMAAGTVFGLPKGAAHSLRAETDMSFLLVLSGK